MRKGLPRNARRGNLAHGRLRSHVLPGREPRSAASTPSRESTSEAAAATPGNASLEVRRAAVTSHSQRPRRWEDFRREHGPRRRVRCRRPSKRRALRLVERGGRRLVSQSGLSGRARYPIPAASPAFVLAVRDQRFSRGKLDSPPRPVDLIPDAVRNVYQARGGVLGDPQMGMVETSVVRSHHGIPALRPLQFGYRICATRNYGMAIDRPFGSQPRRARFGRSPEQCGAGNISAWQAPLPGRQPVGPKGQTQQRRQCQPSLAAPPPARSPPDIWHAWFDDPCHVQYNRFGEVKQEYADSRSSRTLAPKPEWLVCVGWRCYRPGLRKHRKPVCLSSGTSSTRANFGREVSSVAKCNNDCQSVPGGRSGRRRDRGTEKGRSATLKPRAPAPSTSARAGEASRTRG